jgi:hypothetical protein
MPRMRNPHSPSCAETRPTTTSAPAGVRQCTPYPARAALAGAREALLTTRWTPPRNGSRDLGPLFARLHGPSHAFRQTMVSARRGASLHVPGRGRPEARRGGPTAGAAPPPGEPMGDAQLRKQSIALKTAFGTTACNPRGFAGGSTVRTGIGRGLRSSSRPRTALPNVVLPWPFLLGPLDHVSMHALDQATANGPQAIRASSCPAPPRARNTSQPAVTP